MPWHAALCYAITRCAAHTLPPTLRRVPCYAALRSCDGARCRAIVHHAVLPTVPRPSGALFLLFTTMLDSNADSLFPVAPPQAMSTAYSQSQRCVAMATETHQGTRDRGTEGEAGRGSMGVSTTAKRQTVRLCMPTCLQRRVVS